MCKDCGCQEANKKAYFHKHESDHGHSHDHDHNHDHSHTISVGESVIQENDRYAQANRQWFFERGMLVLNFISSPGSGKTLFLEKTLELLRGKLRTQVLVGDQQTDLDAQRLAGKGAEVKQINTYSSCHLDAHMIGHEIESFVHPETELLLIENVGNLVCPAAFDLGEQQKVALLSCTEGEDKPIKYPVLFQDASLIILTKADLQPHLDWSAQKCVNYIRQINHRAPILTVSGKTGEGMSEWISYLLNLCDMNKKLKTHKTSR